MTAAPSNVSVPIPCSSEIDMFTRDVRLTYIHFKFANTFDDPFDKNNQDLQKYEHCC